MRDIKFRAWTGLRMMFKTLDDNNWYDSSEQKGRQITGKSTSDCRKYNVMQFTGLTDKNGVEIYEGDKLYFHHDDGEGNYAGVVEWIACGDWLGWGLMIQGHPDELLVNHQDDLEVIGNTYQNPELLKDGS
mgnify:CR=1 FL=1|tara:strand:+ start:484 stop:876 length:393 start_codon:yes stop_codon:yes gene_type:complete